MGFNSGFKGLIAIYDCYTLKLYAKVIKCQPGRKSGMWLFYRQTDKQTDRQTDRQTNRQTDKQTDSWLVS